MLALTECHYTPSEFEPQGITAAVVGNPILDWTSLFPSDPFLHVSKTGFFPEEANFSKVSVNEALSIDSLCVIRQQFFSKAEKYFDPFASPLLFFRTPSSDTPNETVTSLTNQSFNDALIEDGTMPFPVKKRHSLRKHPPVNSDLVLPSTRVDVGKDFAAKNQAIEFVDLMRKSFRRSEVEREGLAGISVKRRFEVIERDGMDLWDAKRMLEVGQWFSEVLRQP